MLHENVSSLSQNLNSCSIGFLRSVSYSADYISHCNRFREQDSAFVNVLKGYSVRGLRTCQGGKFCRYIARVSQGRALIQSQMCMHLPTLRSLVIPSVHLYVLAKPGKEGTSGQKDFCFYTNKEEVDGEHEGESEVGKWCLVPDTTQAEAKLCQLIVAWDAVVEERHARAVPRTCAEYAAFMKRVIEILVEHQAPRLRDGYLLPFLICAIK